MKLHTTIRSLGFRCFGEQLQISAADHTMVPSKKRRRDGRSGMPHDASIAKSTIEILPQRQTLKTCWRSQLVM